MPILNRPSKVVLELDFDVPALSKIFVDGEEVANVTDIKLDVGIHREPEFQMLAVNTIGENILHHLDNSHIEINTKCPVCGYVRTGAGVKSLSDHDQLPY